MTSQSEEVRRLLASLAGYSNQGQDGRPYATSISSGSANFASNLPGLGGLPIEEPQPLKSSTPNPYQPSLTPQRSAANTPQPSTTLDPRLQRSSTSTPKPPKPPVPDASTITDWPTAISHVMTHLAPDATFATKIRRLITSQHAHERDWHDKRAAIVSQHASRDASSAQLSSIFASLGVPVPNSPATGTATPSMQRDLEAERRELQAYDAKVYKQLLALAGDFDRQLRGLGVPFYAIRHELVVLEEGREREAVWEGKRRIDKGELRELQRRMLGWLEMSFPV
ncbi:uncharacterized protein HMPREF1541_02488 [Cyphellophora europaea CBS 101466]|uniref:Uncharacterized protein n=1 Tax=Cyphellophora europaea (strain CBS 101466) TaxID=1220924 RepID=W2S5W3_CYPE1|nr:uncharacterized protein HMPREF1541_02488 [Cyphellophora europaea CBS 101466]ETN43329.1 hypothetical protein HMPREF1541_02488 [Cyphellophora europaea CBS 101466]